MRFLFVFVSAGLLAASSIQGHVPSQEGKSTTQASDAELGFAAASAGVEPAEFRRIAKTSRALHLGKDGHAFFACDGHGQVGPDTSNYIVSAPYPLTQTFLLHSRPGATKVIYLDFNGRTMTGTAWKAGATFTIPPYDIDGNPLAFSNAEKTNIQDIWRRVAEDYAPFDVDVTTEDPTLAGLTRTSTSDATYGVRCLIGKGCTTVLGTGAAAGGVAKIGYFDIINASGTNDSPCFVFPEFLGSDGSAAQTFNIGECCSHEVGHTLGLYHASVNPVPPANQDTTGEYYCGHGTGVDSWSPIMGASYYKTVSHWSKGEYTGARNGAGTGPVAPFQDEVAIIASRVPLLSDDHGNNAATATDLGAGPLTVSGANKVGGIIGSQSDIDYFKFQAGPGAITLNGLVSAASPNLKLQLSLFNSAGTLLITNVGGSTGTGMGAVLTTTVATNDTYYLKVEGVGQGLPTTSWNDYGSLGRYAITGSWGAPTTSVAAIQLTNTFAGSFPFVANFSGLSSTSTAGTVVGYQWNFGDAYCIPSNNTSILASPTHTYTQPGNYTVSLVVTDSVGSVSTQATYNLALVPPVLDNEVHVGAMTPYWQNLTRVEAAATVAIKVVDQYGLPLRGALVTVGVTGSLTGKTGVRSDAAGMVYVSMPKQRKVNTATYVFTVLSVQEGAHPYVPAHNVLTSATVSGPAP
jgi:PKD repeat protein